MIGNYEALTPAEKQTVPIASYLRAKTDFPRNIPDTNPRHALLSPAEQVTNPRLVRQDTPASAPLLVVQDSETPPQAERAQKN